jgi:hypothetical protein
MTFKYDQKNRQMLDDVSGDSLVFERKLPEGSTHVCHFMCKDLVVPFCATLTWESVDPPRAVWWIDYLGKNLLGEIKVHMTAAQREAVISRITEALLIFSAERGQEFEGVCIRLRN